MSTTEHSLPRRRHAITKHARIRLQQRSIRPNVLDFFLRHADRDANARGRCRELRLGDSFMPVDRADSQERELIERARRLRVIEAEEGTIVTAMWTLRRSRPRLHPVDAGAARREIEAGIGEWHQRSLRDRRGDLAAGTRNKG
jgi:hypothetical protein